MSLNFYRRVDEIDFLRALAIFVVVVNHLGGLGGGYIGVDIFFVISGYVITLSALKEHKDDLFSLRIFFKRRISRILPPLSIVILLSFLAGYYIFFEREDFQFLTESYLYQGFFAQNFYFTMQAANYFNGLPEAKLNLHLWSVAVEEQFYFIFPIIFMLFYKKANTWKFFAVNIVMGLTSLVLMVYMSKTSVPLNKTMDAGSTFYEALKSQQGLYYLPLARLWQLLVGVLACCLALYGKMFFEQVARRPQWQTRGFFLINLAVIGAACVIMKPNISWPNAWSIPLALSTAFLLTQLHFSTDHYLSAILNFPPIRYVGRSSYSIYLYHWPVFAILTYTNSTFGKSPLDFVAYLLLLFFLSYLSYTFIERKRHNIQRFSGLILVIYVLGNIALSFTPLRKPESNSALGEILTSGEYNRKCQRCSENVDKPFLVVWGDSHARGLLQAFDDLAYAHDVKIIFLSHIPIAVDSETDRAVHARARKLIKSPNFRGLFLVVRWSFYWKIADDDPDAGQNRYISYDGERPKNQNDVERLYPKALNALFNEIGDSPTILLKEVPRFSFSPKKEALMSELDLVFRSPVIKTKSEHYRQNEWINDLIDQTTAGRANIVVVDPTPILCPDTECQWRNGNTVFYKDDNHLSMAGAALMRPILDKAWCSVSTDRRDLPCP